MPVRPPKDGAPGPFAIRAEIFHQMLMEDFRFMEAARMQSGQYEGATLSTDDLKPLTKVRELMMLNPQGLINFATYSQRPSQIKTKKESIITQDFRTRRFLTRMSRYAPIDIWAHWLHHTHLFSALMITVIVMSSLLIAVESEIPPEQKYGIYRTVIESLDFFFLCMFVTEILLKWFDNFTRYWIDAWNWFDFFVTVLNLGAPILDLTFQDSDDAEGLAGILQIVGYIRIMRIFRSLNVVTRIRKIEIIWAAITRTFTSLFFITVLMLIFFYIFAIIGIQAFERYSRSHRNDLEYHRAFRDLPNAMITLFQIFTLDHWYDILDSIAVVTGDATPVMFVLLWILLGSLIFKNIFVGVMVNNFQNIRQELNTEQVELSQKSKLAVELNIFGLDDLEEVPRKETDPLVDWEGNVFHNLEIIRACEQEMSPSLWPRDTLFQYFIILEALANNIDERSKIFRLLNQALLRSYDR